ncbi:VOC family protein [Nocardioides sp.]|uniref:VOC family protein n=1 Tax=Nocardioides sp. TaxID=35761 RepID=UPI00271A1D7F|nr:hypothetical protein [Nocardioides sp.]MDO9455983.1 hypothetical protein [Nocardioides sp.]
MTAVLAAVPVGDLDAAQHSYERLLGTSPSASPMPGLAQWDLGDGVLQIVLDADRAGGGLVTLMFDDLAAAAEAVRGRGIELEVAAGEVVSAVTRVLDPDGNAITLVEA